MNRHTLQVIFLIFFIGSLIMPQVRTVRISNQAIHKNDSEAPSGNMARNSSTNSVIRDCRNDGTIDLTGKIDSASIINICLINAIKNHQGAVQLPCGQLRVDTAIDDTNKPNLTIRGCQANQDYSRHILGHDFGTNSTQIICNTGSICWDATGSGRQRLQDFAMRLANASSTPSTVGFLFGRDNAISNGSASGMGTYCTSEETTLDNIWIYADSNPKATTVGRVAIYNVGAEQFVVLGGGYVADAPVFLSDTNDLALFSPYQTLAEGCATSMTEVKFGHGVVIQPWTRPAFDLRRIIDFETEADTEIFNGGVGTNHNAAFAFQGNGTLTNIFLRGQVENFDFAIKFNANVDRLKAELTAVDPVNGIIAFANDTALTNSEINIAQRNGKIQPLLNPASGSGVTIKGTRINLAGLSGSGTAAHGITVTQSEIFASGLSNGDVNIFAAGSNYLLYDDIGISTVGELGFGEGPSPLHGVSHSADCYADSASHTLKCSYNNGPFLSITQTVGYGIVMTTGTPIGPGTCQVQKPLTILSAEATDTPMWGMRSLPVSWQTGIQVVPIVTADSCTITLCNPSTRTIIPSRNAISCRIVR